MDWTPRLSQLNDVLGDLVPHHESIIKFVRDSGLKPQQINFNGNALDIWNRVIDEARKQDKVTELVQSVLQKYPDNPFLLTASQPEEINYMLGNKLDDEKDWRGIQQDTFEVLTSDVNTLLPVYFLARGIICSRSVAKVEIKRNGMTEVGTGFLCKVSDAGELLFMTNSHVISNKNDISGTKIIFDYEEDINGNTKASKSYSINPQGVWINSPKEKLDLSVFSLNADDTLKDYGYILLNEVTAKRNDFVNIIQHPGGQLKKIAIYHNTVTNVEGDYIQYLTDTMQGSSGSPVFNSDWNVVALHHKGGATKANEPNYEINKYRNEGVCINKIISFIKQQLNIANT